MKVPAHNIEQPPFLYTPPSMALIMQDRKVKQFSKPKSRQVIVPGGDRDEEAGAVI